MMRKIICATLIIPFVLFSSLAFGQSQDDQDVTASATVEAALSITATDADLEFGTVLQGDAVTINSDDAGTARWTISGEASQNINLTFTFPEDDESNLALQLDDDSSNYLPLSFSATSAEEKDDGGAADGTSQFDPTSFSNPFTIGSGGALEIFLGGTVTAAGGQEPGLYEGTINLAVEYAD